MQTKFIKFSIILSLLFFASCVNLGNEAYKSSERTQQETFKAKTPTLQKYREHSSVVTECDIYLSTKTGNSNYYLDSYPFYVVDGDYILADKAHLFFKGNAESLEWLGVCACNEKVTQKIKKGIYSFNDITKDNNCNCQSTKESEYVWELNSFRLTNDSLVGLVHYKVINQNEKIEHGVTFYYQSPDMCPSNLSRRLSSTYNYYNCEYLKKSPLNNKCEEGIEEIKKIKEVFGNEGNIRTEILYRNGRKVFE